MASADSRERRADGLIALGTAVVSLGLLLGLPLLDRIEPDEIGFAFPAVAGPAWTVVALGLLAQSAALFFARRAPRASLVVIAALPIAVAALASTAVHGLTMLPVVVAVVLAVMRMPLARLWPALVAASGLVVIGESIVRFVAYGVGRADVAQGLAEAGGQGFLQAFGVIGLPVLIALVVRSRREVRRARTDELSAKGRESAALVDAAVARERTAMARELHDIAAHHLSGIALMAAVIDRQIDSDPERAHQGARQVREQSTAVLDDLRRLVGLLRDDAPAERSVETVAGIVDLVERARLRSDVRIDVLTGSQTEGAAGRVAEGVGPLAQLAAYRTAQEALANAALHAPAAPCVVTIDDRHPAGVTVSVENEPAAVALSGSSSGDLSQHGSGSVGSASLGSSAAGGNGLRGMRERADLVGATLHVGPTAAGGWRVELVLNREAPASVGGDGDAAAAAAGEIA